MKNLNQYSKFLTIPKHPYVNYNKFVLFFTIKICIPNQYLSTLWWVHGFNPSNW